MPSPEVLYLRFASLQAAEAKNNPASVAPKQRRRSSPKPDCGYGSEEDTIADRRHVGHGYKLVVLSAGKLNGSSYVLVTLDVVSIDTAVDFVGKS